MNEILKQEKAIQHCIVYAQFLSKEFTGGAASAIDILVSAAARAYSAQEKKDLTPDEWLGVEFANYMKEVCIEQIWPPVETISILK